MLKKIFFGTTLILLLMGTFATENVINLNSRETKIDNHSVSGEVQDSESETSEQVDNTEDKPIGSNGTVIFVNPSVVTVKTGQSFLVNIEIDDAPLVDFWYLDKVTWNPAVLQIIADADIIEGNFLKQPLRTTSLLFQPLEPGTIPDIACGLFSGKPVSGDGVLFSIRFKAIASGVSHINIDFECLLLNLTSQEMPSKICDGSVTVIDGVPLPPTSVFKHISIKPKVGWPVTFDASASTPNEGKIVSYEWDFGDGSYATGKVVNHTYTSPSVYTVKLNVTDDERLWAVGQKPIEVSYAWTGSVYIRTDGSVDPAEAPIQGIGDYYVLTGNIISDTDGILIERDNIILDGAGYTIQTSKYPFGSCTGIIVLERRNVTITNIEIIECSVGIAIGNSTFRIIGNNIKHNGVGIQVDTVSNSSILGNNIANNEVFGITLYYSINDTMCGNNLTANYHSSIFIEQSFNNSIYHNNFVDSRCDFIIFNSVSTWDNGYPSGGNYWDDYIGEDSNGDGIGDTPYVLCDGNEDCYPLMNPY